MSDISGTVRPTNFKLGTQVDDDELRHAQAPCPPRSNPKVTRSRDQSDACRSITRERKAVETPKLVGSFSTTRAMFRTSFKVKKVKAQGHRSIYSHTQNTSYLPNGKAYELQTSYAGRGQSPASLATTMTSKIKGQGHMVCLTRPAHNSRTNSRRIINIGSKAHDMSNIAAMLLHPGGGIP